MESACLRETDRQVELEDSVIAWQDKYDRLYESHKRVQKVNQSLEDKLLKLVDRNAGERAQLTSDVATLSVRLAQANYNIAKLQREIERYKTDINLAIQLLQCKPDSFVSQKVSSLPIDIQSKVSSYMRLETNSHSDSEGSTSGVGVATSGSYKVLPASDSPPPACPFPPTAMVYSMRGIDAKSNSNETSSLHSNNNCATKNNNNNNISTSINSPLSKTHHSNNTSASIINNNNTNNNTSNNNNNNNNNNINNINNNITTNGLTSDPDMISPALMAKFLEEELKSSEVKHCDTCQCSTKDLTVLADVSRSYSVSTQTPFSAGTTTNLNEPLNALCLRCNSNLNSPSRTNSPYLMKLVKSSDSVISETKSSVSDLNDVDKLFTPAKREDLMVNPILGHHRLCERTAGSGALNSGANLANSHKFNYPNSSLVNYQSSYTSDSATKYILEPCNTPTSNGNGYQRKFLDGGGTALDLLEYRPKYDASNTPKLDNFNRQDSTTDGNGAGNDDIEDEAKPLLGGISQTNLLDSEKKFDHDHSVKTTPSSACDSGSNNKMNSDLTKTTMSGSVNSLWSKTSSCEGAKMFENFNRNLIKTIKAENPKYRGPRLCAMRIQQNGQSNVLLDNIESIETVTPIIYTRRERFLDEELDDNKDIITSKTSTTVSPMQKQNEINISESTSGEVQSKQSNNDELQNQNIHEENQITDEQQSCQGMENRIGDKCDLTTDSGGGLITNSTGVIPDIVETHNAREVKTPQDEEQGLLVHNVKLVPSLPLEYTAAEQDSDRKLTNSFREQHHKTLISSEQQQQLLKASLNYDVLHKNDVSCKNSQKSYTQSSSISDVIDFQESMMLRRQQLSRVAEWVQNNSQQLQEQQQQEQQHQQPTLMTAGVNHGGCSSGTTDQQSSYSAMDQYDSISMEKLSMDSGYKTTPQLQTNGYTEAHSNQENILKAEDNQQALKAYNNIKENNNACNNTSTNINNSSCKTSNTYYRRTGRSGLPIPYNTLPDEQTNCSSNCTMSSQPNEQGTTCDILNYKYYPSESDRSLAIKAELHTTTKHVDIAQMEYNVKQFLLKQNEWSIRNSRANTTTSASRSNCNNTASATAQNYSMNCNNAVLKQQHEQGVTRSLRQSKLFNSSGIGPGVGERVLAKSMTTTTVATSTTTTTAVSGKIPGSTTGSTSTDAQQRSTPHRTETNL